MRASSRVSYYRSKSHPWVEVAQVRGNKNAFPRHYHDDSYSIGLIDTGAAYCLDRDDRNMAVEGSSVLINPGQIHTGIPVAGKAHDYRMIYFKKEELQKSINEYRRDTRDFEFASFISRDPELHEALHLLAACYIKSGTEAESLERDCLIINACMKLSRAGTRSTSSRTAAAGGSSVMNRMKMILSDDLHRQISLEEISAELGLSRYQLLRAFKKAYGITPHVYRTQCRLEKAASLLRQSHSLIETANETGFADQSHFSRSFRNFFGATPGQYASCVLNS